MKTLIGLSLAFIGLNCESVHLSFLCACICLVLIFKSK